MTEAERDKKMRDLLGDAIMDALGDEDERKKPAWASIAASFLDGKGRKTADQGEINEYAQIAIRNHANKSLPDLDEEGDDPTTDES